MKRISFTQDARQDMKEIYEYIAEDNIAAADKHMQRLQERWRALLNQPRLGRKREEIRTGYRSVTAGDYVIFYRPLVDGIEVMRVIHGSRDIKKIVLAD